MNPNASPTTIHAATRLIHGVGASAILLLLCATTTQAAVVGNGIASVGVGATAGDPVSAGMEDSNCVGVPIVAVACTLTVAGSVQACAYYDASLFGFNALHGEICGSVGFAGCAAGTASLTAETRVCTANVQGFNYESKHHRVCQFAGYVHDYVIEECHDEAENATAVAGNTDTDGCSEANDWIEQEIQGIRDNLTHPPIPGWHQVSCGGKASVGGNYACYE